MTAREPERTATAAELADHAARAERAAAAPRRYEPAVAWQQLPAPAAPVEHAPPFAMSDGNSQVCFCYGCGCLVLLAAWDGHAARCARTGESGSSPAGRQVDPTLPLKAHELIREWEAAMGTYDDAAAFVADEPRWLLAAVNILREVARNG